MVYFWGVFGHFGALFRVPGVTDVRCCRPECGWDCTKQEIGSGYESREAAT